MHKSLVALVLLVALAIAVPAQAADAERLAKLLAPYVNDDTVAVIHVDMKALNTPDFYRAYDNLYTKAFGAEAPATDKSDKPAAKPSDKLREMIELFNKGSGEMVIIMGQAQPLGAAVITPNSNIEPLLKFFGPATMLDPKNPPADKKASVAIRKGDLLIVGTAEQLANLPKPSARPELQDAFAAVEKSLVKVAVMPDKLTRQVFIRDHAKLPKELGELPSAPIQGLTWAAAGVEVAPKLSARVVAKAADEKAAAELKDLGDKVLASLDSAMNVKGASLAEAIKLTVKGDTVTATADADGVTAVASVVGGVMKAASSRARMAFSASMAKQLYTCVVVYKAERGEWPATYEDMIKEKTLPSEKLLTNPRFPGRKPGFVYIQPKEMTDPKTVVIYENYDSFGEGIYVTFFDGSVELVRDEAKFREMLKKK